MKNATVTALVYTFFYMVGASIIILLGGDFTSDSNNNYASALIFACVYGLGIWMGYLRGREDA